MNIYVGNLPYSAEEEDLRKLFEEFGEVDSVKIIIDKYSGKSKGFGFVEMTNGEEGNEAIQNLNDSDMDGRNLKVNEARERTERRNNNRGGGGGGYRGGGGGGGGYNRDRDRDRRY